MTSELPTIMIPYQGPSLNSEVQDIFIYLRPEANGILVESTILKVIMDYPALGEELKFAYMANIPGSFITRNRIIEQHYRLKIFFAREGKNAFTQTMREGFEEHFRTSFAQAEIIGAFKALERLKMSHEELFHLWVPNEDFFVIHRQTIKRYGKFFIVNYDIPALLHKYHRETNIFVMILRSFLSYRENQSLMDLIYSALESAEIVTDRMPLSYILHYSKGPFEQILDGIGYVYTQGKEHVPYSDLSFFAFLSQKGLSEADILHAFENPIMHFSTASGPVERNLFDYTREDSFETAYRKFESRIR
ncbi:hypothetical protein ES703_124362 [subsurface metagenome]